MVSKEQHRKIGMKIREIETERGSTVCVSVCECSRKRGVKGKN